MTIIADQLLKISGKKELTKGVLRESLKPIIKNCTDTIQFCAMQTKISSKNADFQ